MLCLYFQSYLGLVTILYFQSHFQNREIMFESHCSSCAVEVSAVYAVVKEHIDA